MNIGVPFNVDVMCYSRVSFQGSRSGNDDDDDKNVFYHLATVLHGFTSLDSSQTGTSWARSVEDYADFQTLTTTTTTTTTGNAISSDSRLNMTDVKSNSAFDGVPEKSG